MANGIRLNSSRVRRTICALSCVLAACAPAEQAEAPPSEDSLAEVIDRYQMERPEDVYSIAHVLDAIMDVLPLDDALPQDDRDDLAVLEHEDEWQSWAHKQRNVDPDDVRELVAILTDHALTPGGDSVLQRFNRRLYGRVAAASCRDGSPIIYFEPAGVAALSPPALRFIRAHELGHVFSNHINCDSGTTSPSYTEKAADCWAVEYLEPYGQLGADAIAAAAQFLYERNTDTEGPYEASRARSRYLRDRCQG